MQNEHPPLTAYSCNKKSLNSQFNTKNLDFLILKNL